MGTVTLDGGKVTEAGRWLENKVASVKVDRTLKWPVFIAAMRLRDVASEVASTLKQFPASFEVKSKNLVVYTWHETDSIKVFSVIYYDVVGESQGEVYAFADNSRSKQSAYSRLADWTTQYAHSVCMKVDKKNCNQH